MAESVTITSFTFAYPGAGRPALRDFSLTVPAGSCCVVLGPTGAGKSSLLHALAGILGAHHKQASSSGSIKIGPDLYRPMAAHILFPKVGLFLQDPTVQISGIRETVEEEVRFALDNLRVAEAEVRTRVRLQLEELDLARLARRPIRQLSGGELQRVALAGMLVGSPSVVLLDEPLNSLDATSQARLIRLLTSFKGTRTVIITDYGIDTALRIADHVVVLHEGSALYSGRPGGLIQRARQFSDVLPTEHLAPLAASLDAGGANFPDRRFFGRLSEAE